MKKKYIYIAIIIAIGIIFVLVSGNKDAMPDYEYVALEKADLVQEVSVSGRVEPLENINLAFQRGGRIAAVNVSVGDTFSEGDRIAVLDQTELLAQLQAARATMAAGQAKLSELNRGARPEEVLAVETKVSNAEGILRDAEAQLLTTINKNEVNIDQIYALTLNKIKEAVVATKNAIVDTTQIQQTYYNSSDNQIKYVLSEAKAEAVESLFGEMDAGNWVAEYVANLSSGLYGEAQEAELSDINADMIHDLLSRTMASVSLAQGFIDAVPVTDQMTSTDKATISAQKTALTSQGSLLTIQDQAILVQEANAESLENAANTAILIAQNTLDQTKDQLVVIKSGSSAETIAAQEASVASARANVALFNAQLSHTVIKSPIDGVVTIQDAHVGETAGAFVPLVTIMSKDSFEIELFVAEADIAKVSVGDKAKVTLDAYGDDEVFEAEVIFIDPAEVLKSGVPAYKVTLLFVDTRGLVRSGMTANTDIVTHTREGVLAIRSRAVIEKDGLKYVRVLQADGSFKEVPVTVGMKSSDGRIEIIDGVAAGVNIITYIPR